MSRFEGYCGKGVHISQIALILDTSNLPQNEIGTYIQ